MTFIIGYIVLTSTVLFWNYCASVVSNNHIDRDQDQ